MSSPFFSVIIPVYNREDLVVRAIKSVLQQSFKDYELIIKKYFEELKKSEVE